jgi:hypothetical protein
MARERGGSWKLTPISAVLDTALPPRVLRNLPGWRGVLIWADAVGPEAARRSRAVAFREGRLIVEVTGSAWMHQLVALKRQLVTKVNRAIGSAAVEDIVFVVNPTLGSPPSR